jgi:membrane-associated protease RseP (regulator of RpoE activity)
MNLVVLLALLALSSWQSSAWAAPGTRPPAAGDASAAGWYECLEPEPAARVPGAFGLMLCTAHRTGESRPEGIVLPDRAVLVTAVEPGSTAAGEGLVAGDAIYRVNGRSVEEADEAARRLSERTAGETRVNFLRDGRPYIVRLWRA